MSLDKDASSDPNLKAGHAGASMRKAQHLQPKATDAADAEVGCFAFSRLAAHRDIRVLSKSGPAGKSPLCQQNDRFNVTSRSFQKLGSLSTEVTNSQARLNQYAESDFSGGLA